MKRTRPPAPPGDLLYRLFMEPLGLTQTALAESTNMSRRRINEIVNNIRSISEDSAVRLALVFGNTPEFWMNLQTRYNMWLLQNDPDLQKEYKSIKPIKAA